MALQPTTWNPADKGSDVVLSGGNLTAAVKVSHAVRSVFAASSRKWYWEVSRTAGVDLFVGVATAAAPVYHASGAYPGANAQSWGYYSYNGNKFFNNLGSGAAYGATFAVGAVIGVALDMDAGTLTFYKNGVSQGVAYTGLSGDVYAMVGGASNGATSTCVANFGASAFAQSPPAGHLPGFGPAFEISGTVTDVNGDPAQRTLRAYRRDTGALVGEAVSDSGTGAWSMIVPSTAECTVVCLDDSAGSLENDLVHRVVPA